MGSAPAKSAFVELDHDRVRFDQVYHALDKIGADLRDMSGSNYVDFLLGLRIYKFADGLIAQDLGRSCCRYPVTGFTTTT
eukprot:760520-Hanusia_phi.AAC.6